MLSFTFFIAGSVFIIVSAYCAGWILNHVRPVRTVEEWRGVRDVHDLMITIHAVFLIAIGITGAVMSIRNRNVLLLALFESMAMVLLITILQMIISFSLMLFEIAYIGKARIIHYSHQASRPTTRPLFRPCVFATALGAPRDLAMRVKLPVRRKEHAGEQAHLSTRDKQY